MTPSQRRALEIIRDNPRIEGGHRFAREMWPDRRSSSVMAANPLLARLYEAGLVDRRYVNSGRSGDKGCNTYWLTDAGRAALAEAESRP